MFVKTILLYNVLQSCRFLYALLLVAFYTFVAGCLCFLTTALVRFSGRLLRL